jgi:hypothetical protein
MRQAREKFDMTVAFAIFAHGINRFQKFER